MSEQLDEREGLPSASGMDRLANCPGSRKAEAGLGDLPTDQATEDGIMVHEAKELEDESALDMTQLEIKRALDAMEQLAIDNWRVAIENGEI